MSASENNRANANTDTPPAKAAGLSIEQRMALFRTLKESGKTVPLRTEGLSMRPLIRADSTVDLLFAPAAEVRCGDIILFYRGDALVLHRVISILRDEAGAHFVEKGDHQPFHTTIPQEHYLGVVQSIQTGRRRVSRPSRMGRCQAWLFLHLSRLEAKLYAIKVRFRGPGPTRTGRWVHRLLNGVRGLLLRLSTWGGKGGGSSP